MGMAWFVEPEYCNYTESLGMCNVRSSPEPRMLLFLANACDFRSSRLRTSLHEAVESAAEALL